MSTAVFVAAEVTRLEGLLTRFGLVTSAAT